MNLQRGSGKFFLWGRNRNKFLHFGLSTERSENESKKTEQGGKLGSVQPPFRADIVYLPHTADLVATNSNPAGGAVKFDDFTCLDIILKKILLDHVEPVVVFQNSD